MMAVPARWLGQVAEVVALVQARPAAIRCRCRFVTEWDPAVPCGFAQESTRFGEEEQGLVRNNIVRMQKALVVFDSDYVCSLANSSHNCSFQPTWITRSVSSHTNVVANLELPS
ncbi:hypothetical protein MRX96_055558 [Rhipicephalus microplus]